MFINNFQVFFTILVTTVAPIFFALLLLLIQYLSLTIRCVSWEQLMGLMKLFAISVCMCVCAKKLSVNYGQTIGFFVFFHETEWFCNVLRILNLEGKQNCMIGLKVKAILPLFFQKILKLQTQACGVLIQRQQTGILPYPLRFHFE